MCLVVNDDLLSIMMLESMLLKSCGFQPKHVHRATNGLEAYKMAMKIDYDLILMDL